LYVSADGCRAQDPSTLERVPRALSALVVASALLLVGCAGGAGGAGGAAPAASAPGAGATSAAAATPGSAASCAGVFVTVQFGLLGGDDVASCAAATSPITAAAALAAVGITTAGTQQYGDQVVCRVNGEPSASKPFAVPGHAPYTETCTGMPAAFAYWAVWVRDAATGRWDYAQSGVGTQQLEPGQTLGLKFTTGSDTTPPRG
jgi:hypothetical protein